jgi:hypothetical protein
MDIVKLGEPYFIQAFVIVGHSKHKPTGVVVFKSDDYTIGVVPIDEEGVAELWINSDKLGIGEHRVVAYYAGCEHFRASNSELFMKEIKVE